MGSGNIFDNNSCHFVIFVVLFLPLKQSKTLKSVESFPLKNEKLPEPVEPLPLKTEENLFRVDMIHKRKSLAVTCKQVYSVALYFLQL